MEDQYKISVVVGDYGRGRGEFSREIAANDDLETAKALFRVLATTDFMTPELMPIESPSKETMAQQELGAWLILTDLDGMTDILSTNENALQGGYVRPGDPTVEMINFIAEGCNGTMRKKIGESNWYYHLDGYNATITEKVGGKTVTALYDEQPINCLKAFLGMAYNEGY